MYDIRWQQRFSNYKKALAQLSEAVELSKQRPLVHLEQQGLIKAFEFTYELAWNLIKDYFNYEKKITLLHNLKSVCKEDPNFFTEAINYMQAGVNEKLEEYRTHALKMETVDNTQVKIYMATDNDLYVDAL